MNARHAPQPRRDQYGASLLEVLITILIMSFGLLGLAGLTAASLQTAKIAQFQSTALQLVNEYTERMRGNEQGVLGNNYDMTDAYSGVTTGVSVPVCAAADACTPAELAGIDRAEWINNLRRRLPAGGAYVLRNGLSVDVWILWQEPSLDVDGTTTLAVGATGGSQCPAAALAGFSSTEPPLCMYYRVSI